jgi:transcriptional regulator with XRE-family HTH domain
VAEVDRGCRDRLGTFTPGGCKSSAGPSAVVQRRRLRTELRRVREKAGYTQRDAAQAMDWSISKIVRVELGSVGISTPDLRALLQQYGVTDQAEVERLMGMARSSKHEHWWTQYRETTAPSFLAYAEYVAEFVPGLLQIEEYVPIPEESLLKLSKGLTDLGDDLGIGSQGDERLLEEIRQYSQRATALAARYRTIEIQWDVLVGRSSHNPTLYISIDETGKPSVEKVVSKADTWRQALFELALELQRLDDEAHRLRFKARLLELRLINAARSSPWRPNEDLLPEEYEPPVRPLASTITRCGPPLALSEGSWGGRTHGKVA